MKKQVHEGPHKYSFRVLGGTKVEIKDGRRVLVKSGGYAVCKCMLPDCPHHIGYELAVGRKSLCWNCNQEMILDYRTAKMKKPTHDGCKKRIKDFIRSIA